MRMEKGYRGWGSELTPEISVVEASLDKFFNLDKKDNFIGSDAVKERLKKGIDTKLVYLEVDAQNADVHGNEPVYILIMKEWDSQHLVDMALELKKV